MANELQTKLNAILEDKNTNLLPENLKKGTTLLGIEGSLKEKVKVFSSIDEMNNSTNNTDGDVCLIFGLDPVVPNSEGFSANTMILPETMPLDAGIDFEGMNGLSSKDNGSGITLTCYGWSNTTIGDVHISFDGGGGGLGIYCYSQDTSTNCYKRNYKYSADYGPYLMLNHNDGVIESLSSGRDYTLGELVVENPDSNIWDYIKFANITTIDVYAYNGLASTWKPIRNEMLTKPENIEIGKTAYADGGVITGTMDLSAKKSLNTIYAYVSNDFGPFEYDSTTGEYHYEETLNRPTKPIVLDITSAPENFGDKRYLLVCSFDEMMGGTYYTFLWFDDPNKVLYYQNTIIEGGSYTLLKAANDQSEFYTSGSKLLGGSVADNNTLSNIIKLTPFTEASSTNGSVYIGPYYNMSWVATNCEIRSWTNQNTILQPAGPKASTTKKGSYYTNVFGQRVEGTFE